MYGELRRPYRMVSSPGRGRLPDEPLTITNISPTSFLRHLSLDRPTLDKDQRSLSAFRNLHLPAAALSPSFHLACSVQQLWTAGFERLAFQDIRSRCRQPWWQTTGHNQAASCLDKITFHRLTKSRGPQTTSAQYPTLTSKCLRHQNRQACLPCRIGKIWMLRECPAWVSSLCIPLLM